MSTKLPFPIAYAHANIIVGKDGSAAAVYRANPISYPFCRDKIGWMRRVQSFTYEVKADFSLHRVYREYPAHRYVEQGMRLHNPRYDTTKTWKNHLVGHANALTKNKAYSPEIYLVVHIENPSRDAFSASVRRDFGHMFEPLEKLLGVYEPRALSQREIDGLVEQEENVYRRIKKTLPMRPASFREVHWLYKRAGCRGVCEPTLDENFEPNALVVETVDGRVAYEPLGTDLEALGDTPIREVEDGVLEVRTPYGRYYQAMLTLGTLPEDGLFPDETELLFTPLEDMSFPMDITMHVEWEENRKAIARVRRKVRSKNNQLSEQEQTSHGPLDSEPEEELVAGQQLTRRLKKNDRPPMLRVSILGAIGGAKNITEIKDRVAEAQSRFGTVAWHQPVGAQEELFMDHLPRTDGGKQRSWRDWLTPIQFATLMPIATHDLGSRKGVYFMHVAQGSRRPLFVDVAEASQLSRATAILCAGTQGSGKTTAAQLMLINDVLAGGQGAGLDPKPDMRLEDVPELYGRVGILDLDEPERYVGLLDPLVILQPSRRAIGAFSYYMELLAVMPSMPSEWATHIQKGINYVIENYQVPCSNAVLEWLMRTGGSDSEYAAGDALLTWSKAGLARFGFSDGKLRDIDMLDQVTVIRPSALELPDGDTLRADYSPAERVSVATLHLVAAKAMNMINSDRTIHKTVLFDEAHFLLASKGGRRLISDITRQGRAKNATALLASQNVSDPGEVRKLIGTIFMFGLENREEARAGLELMGLDPDDETLITLLINARKGLCLHKDIHGYIVYAQVDPVFKHLLAALDTTPGARERYERLPAVPDHQLIAA